MTVKQKLLCLLEGHKGESLSGQAIGDALGVSRAAVWKAVKTLKEEGYPIESLQNKGYTLTTDSDILSAQGIYSHLQEKDLVPKILVYDEVTSTNTLLKQMAAEGAEAGTVLLANRQSAGRGRMGRSFYSPQDTGLYMSILLRPQGTLEETLPLTIGAAVALCRSIQRIYQITPAIKWVNDILIHHKKVCGILTEAVADFESHTIDSIILGIGINVNTTAFPEELKNIAASLPYREGIRNRLAGTILEEIFKILPHLKEPTLIEEYKTYCCLLGKEIVYWEKDKEIYARALDINERGNLLVRKENGEKALLSWGEVQVRQW